MRIAVTGSSGLIGSALLARLTAGGHDPVPMVRGPRDDPASLWDPADQWVREGALDGVDAVVHLAGAGIADKRWSAARKRELTESRIKLGLRQRLAKLAPNARQVGLRIGDDAIHAANVENLFLDTIRHQSLDVLG